MSFEEHLTPPKEQNELDQAIQALEAQRPLLGDEIVDIAQTAIREKSTLLLSGSSTCL